MTKWHKNGGLEQKLSHLEKDEGHRHYGREIRARQIRGGLDDPEMIEATRISLAKHEVRKKDNSVAMTPGYGRINRYCGSLDFELENGRYSMGTINRREIAEGIRALKDDDNVPSDEEIKMFDGFMRGSTESPF